MNSPLFNQEGEEVMTAGTNKVSMIDRIKGFFGSLLGDKPDPPSDKGAPKK